MPRGRPAKIKPEPPEPVEMERLMTIDDLASPVRILSSSQEDQIVRAVFPYLRFGEEWKVTVVSKEYIKLPSEKQVVLFMLARTLLGNMFAFRERATRGDIGTSVNLDDYAVKGLLLRMPFVDSINFEYFITDIDAALKAVR